MSEQEQSKPQALPTASSEAGVSFNWQMLDPFGALVGVTMRAPAASMAKSLEVHRHAWMTHALESGWTIPETRAALAQAQQAQAAAATPTGVAPTCQYHGPMAPSTKAPGTWYCKSKMGDGSYCKSKA